MIPNHKPHPRTGRYGAQLAGKLRYAILQACELIDNSDKTIAQLLSEAFQENPLKFMDTVAKHLPKEITAEITRTYEANKLTDDELADVIAERARKRHDEALQADQDKLAATG